MEMVFEMNFENRAFGSKVFELHGHVSNSYLPGVGYKMLRGEDADYVVIFPY